MIIRPRAYSRHTPWRGTSYGSVKVVSRYTGSSVEYQNTVRAVFTKYREDAFFPVFTLSFHKGSPVRVFSSAYRVFIDDQEI